MRKKYILMFSLYIFILNSIYTNVEALTNYKDVAINGLYENTTFYIGSEMTIQALVDGVKNEQVTWAIRELDGVTGIVNVNANGSNATLKAIKPGRAEIIAKYSDGLDFMRNIVVNVKDFPKDSFSQSLISQNIIPIQSRVLIGNIKLVQVEVDKNLSSASSQVSALDKYLYDISARGNVSTSYIESDEFYDFYGIKSEGISNTIIEIRLSKNTTAYTAFKERLENIDSYNGATEGFNNNSNIDSNNNSSNNSNNDNKQPTTGENQFNNEKLDENLSNGNGNDNENVKDESKYIVPEKEITGGLDDVVILGGFGDINNPIKIEINQNLSPEEKLQTLALYMKFLSHGRSFSIFEKVETDKGIVYKLKLFNILNSATVKEFYIDLYVDKNDEELLIPLISAHSDIDDYKGVVVNGENDKKVILNWNSNNTNENIQQNVTMSLTKSNITLIIITTLILIGGATVYNKKSKKINVNKEEYSI